MSEQQQSEQQQPNTVSLSDFISATIPLAERKQQFKEAIAALLWCGGEDDCQVETALEDAVKLAIKHNLAAKAMLPGKLSVIGHIVSKAAGCDHVTHEEAQQLVAELAQKHNWTIEAGKDTAYGLRNLPEVYYNTHSKDFWKRAGGIYVPVGTDMLRLHLSANGFSPIKGDGKENSEIDTALLDIVSDHHIAGAGSYAGYEAGLFEHKGKEFLATDSYSLVEPVAEQDYVVPKHILSVLNGSLGDSDLRFCAWLKSAYVDLSKGRKNGGLCLVIIGEPDACKTLMLKHLITPLLGGRQANAALYLSKSSSFNDEMIGSEVWALDDGNPFTEYEARKAFSDMVKMSVAAEGILGHAKGKAALTMPLYRRLVVLANPDALESAPEITGSMRDKVLLLKAQKVEMPDGCLPIPTRNVSDDWESFGSKLREELPHFLCWLLQDPDVDALCGHRFGTEPWQDPELTNLMAETNPAHVAAAIIFRSCLSNSNADDTARLRATEIYLKCMSGPMKSEATKVLKSPQTVGHHLSAIAEHRDYAGALQRKFVKGSPYWHLRWTTELFDSLCGGEFRTRTDYEKLKDAV